MRTNNLDLQQQQYWQLLDLAALDEKREREAKQAISDAFALVSNYFDEIAVHKSDADLTPSGQRARIAAASERYTKAVSAIIDGKVCELDAEIQDAEAQLARAVASKGDDAARAVLKVEARRIAGEMDALNLEPTYLELCANGRDDLACEAIEEAGALRPLLPAAVIQQGKEIRTARVSPEVSEQVRQLREMRSNVAAAGAQAKREMAVPFATDALMQAASKVEQFSA